MEFLILDQCDNSEVSLMFWINAWSDWILSSFSALMLFPRKFRWEIVMWLAKGQLILKGLFGFFISSKKWTKNFCPSRLGHKLTFISSFWGELKTLNFFFEINLTLWGYTLWSEFKTKIKECFTIKFIYCLKAQNFCEIFTLLLSYVSSASQK